MKAIILKEPGGIENLVMTSLPEPSVKDHEVLVQIKAIGINPVDSLVRQSKAAIEHVLKLKNDEQPIILGWDISGVVMGTGTAVQSFKKGDEVFGMINFPGHGKAYAEYVAAPEAHLALKPRNISHQEAAAAGLAAVTAWQALVTYAKLARGEKVLIHAAAGGVGHFAVQIAKHFGGHVTGTGSIENKDFILALGADEFLDYKNQPFENLVNGVDIVVDSVFGQPHLEHSLQTLRNGGRLISLVTFFDDALKEKLKAKQVFGHRLQVVSNGNDMRQLAALLETAAIKPHITHSFPFNQLSRAHAQIETGKTRGKVVVVL
jgi:NADPH:quinone reductase-like Zn-dependent oxidoreductase